MFRIDARFEATSLVLGDLAICQARLQDDARFPWIVLIPRVKDAREFSDLDTVGWTGLGSEIVLAGEAVRALGDLARRPVAKLNVGQLGNVVPQLHVHVVGRRPDDPAWPGPVWGHGRAHPYRTPELAAAAQEARRLLGL